MGKQDQVQASITPEELELKELITSSLDSQGVLGKIKAQLRAAVFEVLQEKKQVQKTQEVSLALFGSEGEVALELVIEFLEFLQLQHSRSVLLAEANEEKIQVDRYSLRKKLNLENKESTIPLLVELIQTFKNVDIQSKTQEEKVEKVTPSTNDQDKKEDVEQEEAYDEQYEDDAVEIESMSISEELDRSVKSDESSSKTFKKKAKEGEEEEEEEEEEVDVKPSSLPPPVPSKIPSLNFSTLPPISFSSSSLTDPPAAPRDTNEDYDEDEEAARLASLDAKLRELEAEDETGTLEQLKASLQHELEETSEDEQEEEEEDKVHKSIFYSVKKEQEQHQEEEQEEQEQQEQQEQEQKQQQQEELDPYGSDFEEEEEEEIQSLEEEEEQQYSITELSDSVKSDLIKHDRLVQSENALNSYDYIESVERD